nr:hypothetical protein [Tanacetum cinerariifolium]GEY10237.1 hypothetical protein [Tanacetum cinerariifolium]
MADENILAPTPTRSDDQILPFVTWVPIGKTSGYDRPRYPVLQMLWGIISSTNVNYAKLLWEEFVQAIQTFLTDKANLGSPTKKGRKDKPRVIPYYQFTKLIIYYLGRIHNIHQRLTSLFHLAEKDLRLAKNKGKKKPTTAKRPKQKPAKEKLSKPAPALKPKGQAHVGGVAIRELVDEATRPLPVVKATDETSTGPLAHRQDDTSANIVCDSSSPTDAETEEKTDELSQGQAGLDPSITLESRPLQEQEFIDEDQARPDPVVSRVALPGPKSKPTHEEFLANVYPDVYGSLKFPADEHIILEEPLSSSRTLSLMKNMDDAYTIRDQFLNDKPTEDEPGKLNVDSEAVSMVIVPIHQASSLIPPLSTLIIDLSPHKPISSTTQAPIFIATPMTTTRTRPLPPPPPQQSTSDSELAARVTLLEHKLAAFKKKNITLDNTTQNIGSTVFTLELQDLPHKINQTINTVVKEAVHIALQAPLRDRFRELPKADMKDIYINGCSRLALTNRFLNM